MEEVEAENDIVFDQVFACIFSGPEYQQNSKIVFSSIAKGSKTYIDDFLVSVSEVLISPDCPSASKFYALYLLVKATETRNPVLVNQLAGSKDLLNKIFQDAQFDKEKPLAEKGLTFFANRPTKVDALTGNNYIRLALEALRFWSDAFGSSNKPDAGYMFHFMFSTLKNIIKFPETFFYIGRESEVTADFHLKQEGNSEQVNPKETSQPAFDAESVFLQVVSCIGSGSDYKINSKLVITSLLQQNSPVYSQHVLNSLLEIFDANTKDYHPKCKFYCLLLLVQLTETRNSDFVTLLAQKKSLLNRFYKEAKVDSDKEIKIRGQSLFPELANTPDSVIGRNYRILLLEAIKFWEATFGATAEDKSPLANFKTLASSVMKLFPLPQENFYIGTKLDPEGPKGGKSLSRLELLSKIPEEHSESIEDTVNLAELAKEHVTNCTSSIKSFLSNYQVVFNALNQYSSSSSTAGGGYIKSLISNVAALVFSDQKIPTQKFLAMYLLAKATERPFGILIAELASFKELLNKIFQYSQYDKSKGFTDKGKTFFSKELNHIDSVWGNSFVILLLETLQFWSAKYGSKEKENPNHIFKVMHGALIQNGFQFPPQNTYIGTEIVPTLNQLEIRLTSPALVQASSTQSVSQKEEEQKKHTAENQNQHQHQHQHPQHQQQTVQQTQTQTQQTTQKPNQEKVVKKPNFDQAVAQGVLERLDQANQNLLDVFFDHLRESPQADKLISEQLQALKTFYEKDVENLLEEIIDDPSPQAASYMEIFSKENDTYEEVLKHHRDYKNKQVPYSKFRQTVLGLYGIEESVQDAKPEEQEQEIVAHKNQNPEIPKENPQAFSPHLKQEKENEERDSREKEVGSISKNKVPPETETNSNKTVNKNVNSESRPTPQEEVQSEADQRRLQNSTGKSKEKFFSAPILEEKHIEGQKEAAGGSGGAAGGEAGKTGGSPLKKLTLKSPRKDKPIQDFIPQDSQKEREREKQIKIENTKNIDADLEREKEKHNQNPPEMTNQRDNGSNGRKNQSNLQPQAKMGTSQMNVSTNPERKKLSEESLQQSLSAIAVNLNTSRVKTNELQKIHEAIKNSYIKSRKNPPPFEPPAELVAKEKLEEEVLRLKQEKLELAKEIRAMKSHRGEDLTEKELKEYESLKKSVDADLKKRNADIEKVLRENAELKQKVDKLKSEIEVGFKSPQGSPPFKSESSSPAIVEQKRRAERPKTKAISISNEAELGAIKDNKYSYEVLNVEGNRGDRGVEGVGVGVGVGVGTQGLGGASGADLVFKKKTSIYGKVSKEQGKGAVSSRATAFGRRKDKGSEVGSLSDQFHTEELVFRKPGEMKGKSPGGGSPETAEVRSQPDVRTEKEIDKGSFGTFASKRELVYYKLSCLKTGSLLYEDENIQIAVTSSLIGGNPKQKRLLKSIIFYGNKNDSEIHNFKVHLQAGDNISHVVRPEEVDSILVPGKQTKQQVITTVDKISFGDTILHGEHQGSGRNNNNNMFFFSVKLPFLISKFMEFKPTTHHIFEQMWSQRAKHIFESDSVFLDLNIISSRESFNSYWKHLIAADFQTNQFEEQKGDFCLGGVFELDLPGLEYLVKIHVSSSSKEVVFQVAGHSGDHEVIFIILETLKFLFGK